MHDWYLSTNLKSTTRLNEHLLPGLNPLGVPKGLKDTMIPFRFNNNDVKAFSILGAPVGIKWEGIQEKFKKLVKKFHPDMNAGNKKYEDKLKIITLAYTQLKNAYREKN